MRATGTGAGGGATGTTGATGTGSDTLILGAGAGEAAPEAADTRTGGGGAISGAGAATTGDGAATVGDTDSATGPVTFPNSCRTASLRRTDKSTPQSGHAKVIGLRTISGEASKAYFAPQSQRIFIRGQGLGFSSTTFVDSGSAIGDTAGDDFMLPSQNKNVPPYLW